MHRTRTGSLMLLPYTSINVPSQRRPSCANNAGWSANNCWRASGGAAFDGAFDGCGVVTAAAVVVATGVLVDLRDERRVGVASGAEEDGGGGAALTGTGNDAPRPGGARHRVRDTVLRGSDAVRSPLRLANGSATSAGSGGNSASASDTH